jgi:CBS domain-containing protein
MKMNASDVMTSNIIAVHTDATVEQIAAKLLANRICAVPVVDDSGNLVGIVSEGDLIHRVETGTEARRPWWFEMLTGKEVLAQEFIKSHARKAADVMTSPVVCVQPDTPLAEIATVLDKHRIKRVPVVQDGKIVGIVSRANLVQAILRLGNHARQAASIDDSTLQGNILADLKSKNWADPSSINVSVHDGTVELWGAVESEAEKNAVRVAVEVTPGVRAVLNNLVIGRVLPAF